MRIIVTNDGLRELGKSFEEQPTSSNLQTINRSNYTLSKRSKSDILITNTKSILSKKKSILSSYRSMSDITKIDPRTISIKQASLSIPEDQKELYSKDRGVNQPNQIVKQGSDVFLSMQSSNSSSGLPRLKSSYSLKEIIPDLCFNKLNLKLKKEHEVFFHHTKLDEKRLRNERLEIKKRVFDEIEKNKESTIEANNINLIEYLIGKTTITDNFLRNLATYEEERIGRLNKICQKLVEKREREKQEKKEMKNKIKNQRMIDHLNCKKEIGLMEGRMELNKRILELQGNFRKQRALYYSDVHTKFVQNNWEKSHLERYYYCKPRKNKLCYQIKMQKAKEEVV